jgi:hypothetical protein
LLSWVAIAVTFPSHDCYADITPETARAAPCRPREIAPGRDQPSLFFFFFFFAVRQNFLSVWSVHLIRFLYLMPARAACSTSAGASMISVMMPVSF